MIDQLGRTIDYMRVSITDRCNLRCKYCMPDGVRLTEHSNLLRYEELLRLCRLAVSLGIVKFKVTGGEPLVRKGCAGFIARLKAIPGVEQVTITTNGLLLAEQLNALCAAGLDGVNISLDTLQGPAYSALTGFDGDAMPILRHALTACVERGLRVKVNAVLLEQSFDGIPELAGLAQSLPVDVRLIELMPIGAGTAMKGVPVDLALQRLTALWPDLHPTEEKRGNGPARYYAAGGLKGRIGLIAAVSHQFCSDCNRVRLTGTGALKPCLCYEEGAQLRPLLRSGCTDAALLEIMRGCIESKPALHSFLQWQGVTEHKAMNQIGG